MGVRILRGKTLIPERSTSLHQIALPFRFNFRVNHSLEDDCLKLLKGKNVLIEEDGEVERSDWEIGEASNAHQQRIETNLGQSGLEVVNLVINDTGDQRIDIPLLRAPPDEAIYKESLLSARNIVALVVICLVTIGCTTGLNPPGGLDEKGEAAAGEKAAYSVFMMALYSMVLASLFTLGVLCGVTPLNQRAQRKTLRFCHGTMWIGLLAFAVVFVSGCWLIVPRDMFWLKLTGLSTTFVGMAFLVSYIWCRKARKFLRPLSFCDLDGSSDEDEAATSMVTRY